MGKIHVLDHTGDSEVSWTKGNSAEQREAAIRFNELANDQGYLAFKTDQEEHKGEQIK